MCLFLVKLKAEWSASCPHQSKPVGWEGEQRQLQLASLSLCLNAVSKNVLWMSNKHRKAKTEQEEKATRADSHDNVTSTSSFPQTISLPRRAQLVRAQRMGLCGCVTSRSVSDLFFFFCKAWTPNTNYTSFQIEFMIQKHPKEGWIRKDESKTAVSFRDWRAFREAPIMCALIETQHFYTVKQSPLGLLM